MAELFKFEPGAAAVGLARFRAPMPAAGPVVLPAEAFRQGAMGALLRAELLAAQNKLSVPIPVEGGGDGFIVGGARAKALALAPKGAVPANAEQAAALLYMAQQGAVRATLDNAKPSSLAPTLDLGGAPIETVAFPVVAVAVTVAVIGVAALVAGAYVLGKSSAVEAKANEAARIGAVDKMIEAAQMGAPITPEAWNAIAAVAKGEAERSPIDWTTLAVVGAGVAGAWYVLREK
jgi:hypothetical protein